MDKGKKIKAVFLIPFYDKDVLGLIDVIQSIKYYIKDAYKIICINDCINRENIKLIERENDLDKIINFLPVIGQNWPKNTYGSLFCKKYQGIEYVLKNYEFDYLVGMDTDTLITGSDFFQYVDRYFKYNDPKIGLIGSYKIRADGKKRTRWKWALLILYMAYIKGTFDKETMLWKEWIPKAWKNGYKLGEHTLGGAYIFNYKCIKRMVDLYPYNLILRHKMYLINIGDDVIFSLLTFASNFKIGDFGRPIDPLAIAQKYLPIDKENVMKEKKQIIHSIKRGLDGESEEELRTYFGGLRK